MFSSIIILDHFLYAVLFYTIHDCARFWRDYTFNHCLYRTLIRKEYTYNKFLHVNWKECKHILFKSLDRFPLYDPVTIWRCQTVLMSSWRAVTILFNLEFSVVNRIPFNLQILPKYDLWKRETSDRTSLDLLLLHKTSTWANLW